MVLESGESANVYPWDDDSESLTMKLNKCLSIECPSWIVTDTANKRVKVDGRKTRNRNAQGMSIYLFQYDDAITKE